MKKAITVCVPCFNVEDYLQNCLNTLTSCSNLTAIEIIVVDDGSQDSTAEIADQYALKFPGSVYVIHKQNGGHGSTINCALELATAEYFMVVDSDDWVDSNALDLIAANIQQRKWKSDIIASDYWEYDIITRKQIKKFSSFGAEYNKELLFENLAIENTYLTLAGTLFRTEILKKCNEKIDENTYYDDVEYILFPVPFLSTVTFNMYPAYYYRRGNTGQSVHVPNMVKHYADHERVLRRVIAYESSRKFTAVQKDYYDAILKRLLYTHYSLFMIYNKDKQSGFAQGKAFDEFLCKTSPALAKWIGREMPMVRVARRKGFDYEATRRSLGARIILLRGHCKNGLKTVIHRIGSGTFAHKLVYNRFTISIGKMKFFTQGKGKTIKDRLRRYCGFTK